MSSTWDLDNGQINEAFFASRGTLWAQKTTIQHWQLRDLVSCGDSTTDFYTVCHKRTIAFKTTSIGAATVLQDLEYAPTCMAVGAGYVVAGGQQSQLTVTQLADHSVKYHSVLGGSVNNALTICRDPAGEVRLLVSNNDDTIKVYALPSVELVKTIRCAVAINYTAVSPNGEILACVGDCNHTYLYDIKERVQSRIATYTEATDSGMCCAWNAAGTALASASQDGTVCVWDIRKNAVLAKYHAKQGACRAVKFSKGPMDLLAFSEHTNYFHVVDARTYNARQVVRIQEEGESHISGLAFSADGVKLFVGTEDFVGEFIVDTAARRSFPSGSIR